jgi:hypothetical protein
MKLFRFKICRKAIRKEKHSFRQLRSLQPTNLEKKISKKHHLWKKKAETKSKEERVAYKQTHLQSDRRTVHRDKPI